MSDHFVKLMSTFVILRVTGITFSCFGDMSELATQPEKHVTCDLHAGVFQKLVKANNFIEIYCNIFTFSFIYLSIHKSGLFQCHMFPFNLHHSHTHSWLLITTMAILKATQPHSSYNAPSSLFFVLVHILPSLYHQPLLSL
jgi:hypothetical protein